MGRIGAAMTALLSFLYVYCEDGIWALHQNMTCTKMVIVVRKPEHRTRQGV